MINPDFAVNHRLLGQERLPDTPTFVHNIPKQAPDLSPIPVS